MRRQFCGRSRLRWRTLPLVDGVDIERQAEKVGGNKAELRGAISDNADNHAVRRGYDPPLPHTARHETGRQDRQGTGKVIET
jgi:hypothetical protein